MTGLEDYTMADWRVMMGRKDYDGTGGLRRGWRVMTGLEGYDGAGGF